ncbi:hypothetical protein N9N67_12500 [Bacteriovoracaceae bacterium]|nr:hypothetical protein [Bacteriovoracaceae bacterium]
MQARLSIFSRHLVFTDIYTQEKGSNQQWYLEKKKKVDTSKDKTMIKLTTNALLIIFILLVSRSYATENTFQFANSVFKSKKAYKIFLRNWTSSPGKKPNLKQIAKYPYRLIFNLVKFPFTSSETTQRMSRIGESGIYLIQGATRKDKALLKKAGYRLMDGPTNVLGVTDGIISDTAAIASLFKNSIYKHTYRIKLCSLNILNLIKNNKPTFSHLTLPINPIKHIGYVIDKSWETTDPYGGGLIDSKETTGSFCAPAPLIGNESASMAIERLSCLNSEFYSTYSFLQFNCGGYTRILGKYSGVGFEKFNNLGIGNVSFFPHQDKNENREEVKVAANYCNEDINNKLTNLYKLASGIDIKDIEFDTLFYFSTHDLTLQTLVLLSLNNPQYQRRQSFLSSIKNHTYELKKILSYYLKDKNQKKIIKTKQLKKFIRSVTQDLDESAKNWLLHLDPDFKYLF